MLRIVPVPAHVTHGLSFRSEDSEQDGAAQPAPISFPSSPFTRVLNHWMSVGIFMVVWVRVAGLCVLAKILLSPRQGLFHFDHDRAKPRPTRQSPSVMVVADIRVVEVPPVG